MPQTNQKSANDFEKALTSSLSLRQKLACLAPCRLVNSDGDNVSGLFVDDLGDFLRLRISAGSDTAHIANIVEFFRTRFPNKSLRIEKFSGSPKHITSWHWVGEAKPDHEIFIPEDNREFSFAAEMNGSFEVEWRFARKILTNQNPKSAFFGGVSPHSFLDKKQSAQAKIISVFPNPAHNLAEIVQALRSAQSPLDLIVCDLTPFTPTKKFATGLVHWAHHTHKILETNGFLFVKTANDHSLTTLMGKYKNSFTLLSQQTAGPDFPEVLSQHAKSATYFWLKRR